MRRVTLRSLLDQRDLLVGIVVAVAVAVLTVLDVSPIFRVVPAVPLVLFLPGYAVVHAIFPRMVLPAVERLLTSVGASIGLTILAGLLLASAGILLAPASWVLALASITVLGSATAWYRRARLGIVGPGVSIARVSRSGVVMLVVAGLIVADVLLGSRLIASQQVEPPPAQLWMVPVSESPNDAILGVRADGDGGPYRLVISASGNPIYQFEMNLTAGETWERDVSFEPELRTVPIVARLYEGTSDVESRFVVLQPLSNGA